MGLEIAMAEIRPSSPATTTTLSRNHRVRQNVKKLSTPSSTAWKNALKQSCIERARRNRRKRVLASRQNNPSSNAQANGNNVSMEDDIGESHDVAARQLVQEELRESGIAIFSPGMDNSDSNGKNNDSDNNNGDSSFSALPVTPLQSMSPQPGVSTLLSYSPQDMIDHGTNNFQNQEQEQHQNIIVGHHDDYVISELEYYELMQEVEDELQREEALFAEEIEEFERYDQQELEEQIADYEHQLAEELHYQDECFDEQGGGIAAEQQRVLCPVCSNAYLIQTSTNVIQCPNFKNEHHCTFEISHDPQIRTVGSTSLQSLRERLRIVHEEHGFVCVDGYLQFSTMKKNNGSDRNALIAKCETCQYHVDVLSF